MDLISHGEFQQANSCGKADSSGFLANFKKFLGLLDVGAYFPKGEKYVW